MLRHADVALIAVDITASVNYSSHVIEVLKTALFVKWLRELRDLRARARIQIRIDRLALGNPGDWKSVGEGVREMRVDYGPGYRVYFTQRGQKLALLLCAGDKSSQDADIARAGDLAKEWNNGP